MGLEDIGRLLIELGDLPTHRGYPPPEGRHEYDRFVLSIVATAYNYCLGARADLANVVPWGGLPYGWAAANPDDAYRFVAVEPGGVYRISGVRGEEDHATMMMRPRGPNTGSGPGPSCGEVNLLGVPADAEGQFSFILSADPAAAAGEPWQALAPDTTSLFVRQVMLDPAGRETAWQIERLDLPGCPSVPSREDTRQAFANMHGYLRAIIAYNLDEIARFAQQPPNELIAHRFATVGGMPAQMYYTGMFTVEPGQVLVIESEQPEQFRYMGIQLFDRMFNTLDFVAHQSSLNHRQLAPDPDGLFRVFLSPTDPGFLNWLDSGGLTVGGIMWRWHTASSFPQPAARLLGIEEALAQHPASPRVGAQDRARLLAERSRSFQKRRRW